jgi:hypothetical protein
MASLVLVGLLLTGCGTTVQPGQRGLSWRPFSQGLSAETLKDRFYERLGIACTSTIFAGELYRGHIDALSADDLGAH